MRRLIALEHSTAQLQLKHQSQTERHGRQLDMQAESWRQRFNTASDTARERERLLVDQIQAWQKIASLQDCAGDREGAAMLDTYRQVLHLYIVSCSHPFAGC